MKNCGLLKFCDSSEFSKRKTGEETVPNMSDINVFCFKKSFKPISMFLLSLSLPVGNWIETRQAKSEQKSEHYRTEKLYSTKNLQYSTVQYSTAFIVEFMKPFIVTF